MFEDVTHWMAIVEAQGRGSNRCVGPGACGGRCSPPAPACPLRAGGRGEAVRAAAAPGAARRGRRAGDLGCGVRFAALAHGRARRVALCVPRAPLARSAQCLPWLPGRRVVPHVRAGCAHMRSPGRARREGVAWGPDALQEGR